MPALEDMMDVQRKSKGSSEWMWGWEEWRCGRKKCDVMENNGKDEKKGCIKPPFGRSQTLFVVIGAHTSPVHVAVAQLPTLSINIHFSFQKKTIVSIVSIVSIPQCHLLLCPHSSASSFLLPSKSLPSWVPAPTAPSLATRC
jgi:hypothetical protein